mgnify:FL=1
MSTDELIFIRQYDAGNARDELLQFAKSIDNWYLAEVWAVGVVDRQIRRCGAFDISAYRNLCVQYRHIDDLLFQVFSRALNNYVRDLGDLGQFVVSSGISKDEGYQFLRYEQGEHYRIHTDSSQDLPRVLSGIILLNSEYGGGELCFSVQRLTLKPEAGTVILFPSLFTHPHLVCPVTSGIRYSVVTWFK